MADCASEVTVVPWWMIACSEEERVGRGGDANAAVDLVLDDANDFGVSATYALETVDVAAGGDVCFDWSAVTQPAEPTAGLIEFGLRQPAVERGVADDTIGGDFQSWVLDGVAGATAGCLSGFSVLGNPFELGVLAEDPDRTWVLMLLRDGCWFTDPAVAVRPTSASANLEVALTDRTSTYVEAADLVGVGVPLEAVAGTVPGIDWSALDLDAWGLEYVPSTGDRLRVAWFDETDREALQDAVLDLDASADELYSLETLGLTNASLAHARDAGGNPFGGFTTEGTWMVAIDTLALCSRQAPRVLAIVSVTP